MIKKLLISFLTISISFTFSMASNAAENDKTINIGEKIMKNKNNNSLEKFFENSKKLGKNNPVFILLYSKLPSLDEKTISNKISSLEPLKNKVKSSVFLNNQNYSMATIEFDNHKINIVGINAPIPKELQNNTIKTTYWKKEQKDKAQSHKSNIICYYTGDNKDPVEQYIALYKVSYALSTGELVGLANEGAWTFNPPEIIPELVSPSMLKESRKTVPSFFWKGFIQFNAEDGFWYVTKGNHFFGIKDFAYFSKKPDAKDVSELFDKIFDYSYYNGAILKVGDTLQLGTKTYLKFRKVYEYNEYLEGELGTLVLEKINPDDINK